MNLRDDISMTLTGEPWRAIPPERKSYPQNIETHRLRTEFRAEQSGKDTFVLIGRAASYNVLSRDLGGWREILATNCFDDALAARDLDVRATINHDPDKLLGRTVSGTLQVSTDTKGLNYRVNLPNVSYARDIAELCKRGDIRDSSFAFTVDADGQKWSQIPDPDSDTGVLIELRTITRISELFDVSVVGSAAYPRTSASLASRALPPGTPIEVRNRITSRTRRSDTEDSQCVCECPECVAGDCESCSNADCLDENCIGCPNAARSADEMQRKVVVAKAMS
jgi:HK97 family phage prohead protease